MKQLMTQLLRTDSTNQDFKALIMELDMYLQGINGTDQGFFQKYNRVDDIKHVIVAYSDNKAVGCGSIKEYEPGVMELKRFYVRPGYRGRKIASSMLKDLDEIAFLAAKSCMTAH